MHVPLPATSSEVGNSASTRAGPPRLPCPPEESGAAAAFLSTVTRGPEVLPGPVEHQGVNLRGPVWEPRAGCSNKAAKSVQTDPVIVLDPGEYVYVSGGGDCVHKRSGLLRASQSFQHQAESSLPVLIESLQESEMKQLCGSHLAVDPRRSLKIPGLSVQLGIARSDNRREAQGPVMSNFFKLATTGQGVSLVKQAKTGRFCVAVCRKRFDRRAPFSGAAMGVCRHEL